MNLLIAGAGGHGKVVADAAAARGDFAKVAFLDDRFPGLESVASWPVVGRLADLAAAAGRFQACVAAFGEPSLRLRILDAAEAAGYRLPALVHPAATVACGVRLGPGTVILAGAVVNIDATIGRGCIVNSGAVVEHDCVLDDGVHVCPGACLAGEVRIGRCAWIGIGASVIQRVTIGQRVTVGAGAVCTRDVPDDRTVVGVPARESAI